MVDGPVSILHADSQPLLDIVEEAQDYWKRNFELFGGFLLESGKGSCLPAFVLDTFFNAAQKSFIGLREAMQESWLLGELT